MTIVRKRGKRGVCEDEKIKVQFQKEPNMGENLPAWDLAGLAGRPTPPPTAAAAPHQMAAPLDQCTWFWCVYTGYAHWGVWGMVWVMVR